MIIKTEPISLTEAVDYLKEENEKEVEFKKFVKKFVKISPKDALEMKKKLMALGSLKIKPEHIVKIIDILPEDTESINKIFNDISIEEDETKKILDIVKEYK